MLRDMGNWVSVMRFSILAAVLTFATGAFANPSNMMLNAMLASTGTCYSLSHVSTPQKANMVAYWNLDEAAGAATISDSVGTLTGTAVNAPTFGGSARMGNGMLVAGTASSQYVTIPNNSIAKASLPMSVSAWVKINALEGNMAIFSNDAAHNFNGFLLSVTAANKLAIRLGNGAGVAAANRKTWTTTSTVTTGVWYHIVAVANSFVDMHIYVNGKHWNGAFTGTAAALAYSASVGGLGYVDLTTPQYFNGTIDDVAVWNVGLTAAEAKQLYDQQSCGLN